MPRPFPREFREDVVRVARSRGSGQTLKQIAADFGYRLLVDEARHAGHPMADRTGWRICSANGWFSVFGKPKRGKRAKVGAPAHEDRVRRQFSAQAPNVLWPVGYHRAPDR